VKEINEFMASIGEDIQVIWGATFDDTLGEDVKITLIATGYDVSDIPGMPKSTVKKPARREFEAVPNLILNFETNTEEKVEPEVKEPVNPIDEAVRTYYPGQNEAKPVPTNEPVVVSPETIFLGDADKNDFETFSLDELEDDDKLKKAESIPAWKRKLMGDR